MMTTFELIKNWLTKQQVKYTTLHHPPTYTSEESATYRGEDLSVGAKAIIYKIEKTFYLFVMPANRRIDTKKVKAYFKSKSWKAKKTRFATKKELLTQTGLVSGSVPPFGKPILPYSLFIDKSILENEKVAFNAGSLTDSVIMKRKDYIKIAGGELFDFT